MKRALFIAFALVIMAVAGVSHAQGNNGDSWTPSDLFAEFAAGDLDDYLPTGMGAAIGTGQRPVPECFVDVNGDGSIDANDLATINGWYHSGVLSGQVRAWFENRFQDGAEHGCKVRRAVGRDGGLVRSHDGRLTVEFERDALATAEDVVIKPVNELEVREGTARKIWEITPHERDFAVPARVTISIADRVDGCTDLSELRIMRKVDGRWEALPFPEGEDGINWENLTISGLADHFCEVTLGVLCPGLEGQYRGSQACSNDTGCSGLNGPGVRWSLCQGGIWMHSDCTEPDLCLAEAQCGVNASCTLMECDDVNDCQRASSPLQTYPETDNHYYLCGDNDYDNCDYCEGAYDPENPAAACDGAVHNALTEIHSFRYLCECDDGYSGVPWESCCQQGYAGPACKDCAAGYHDDGDGSCVTSCALAGVEDANGKHSLCDYHGVCNDTPSGPVCVCDEGYYPDLGSCEDIRECDEVDPEICQYCEGDDDENNPGVWSCLSCGEGYAGEMCDQCAEGYDDLDDDGICCLAGFGGPDCRVGVGTPGDELWNGGFSANAYGEAVAVDSQGNSIVTGYFVDILVLGTDVYQSVGGYDLFVAKYDPWGEILWSRHIGTAGFDIGYAVTVDHNDDILVAGRQDRDALLNKMSGVTGHTQWYKRRKQDAQSIGEARGVVEDGNNNIWLLYQDSKYCTNWAYPGTWWAYCTAYRPVLMLEKYNTNGGYLYSRRYIANSGTVQARDLAVGPNNQLALLANFNGSFEGLSRRGGYDGALIVLSSNLSLLGKASIGGYYNDDARGVAIDSLGRPVVVGDYDNDIFGSHGLYLNGGTSIFTSVYSDQQGYVARFGTPSGGSLSVNWVKSTWMRTSRRTEYATFADVTVGSGNGVYVAGEFQGSFKIYGSGLRVASSSPNAVVLHIAHYGSAISAHSHGGSSADTGLGVALDDWGNVLMSGGPTFLIKTVGD